jgi:hypothetical protein
MEDYEATITLLTSMLFVIAQLPNGTHMQRRAFSAFEGFGHAVRLGKAPVRAAEHARDWLLARGSPATTRAAGSGSSGS